MASRTFCDRCGVEVKDGERCFLDLSLVGPSEVLRGGFVRPGVPERRDLCLVCGAWVSKAFTAALRVSEVPRG